MIAEYEAAGWRLCAIEPGQKAPRYNGWNVAGMPADAIEALGGGVGLLHALSQTCAIDIDSLELARPWWAEHGVDIDALLAEPSSVQISSGRAGRAKLLYRLGKPLRTLKPTGSGCELRCATAGGESVQDVLPPSIHPITKKPYAWRFGDELVGDWRALPNIPAKVFAVWRDLVKSEPIREVVNTAPTAVAPDKAREAVANYIAHSKTDIDDYNDWLNLGIRIHKLTGGKPAGLMLWNDFSKAGKKYKNLDDLKTHWVSFDAGGALGLDAKRYLPAELDDFEVVAEAEPGEVNTEELIEKAQKNKLFKAVEFLKTRLIFVKCYEKFFDREDHHLYLTNQGIEQMFGYLMPKRKTVVKMLIDLGADKPIVDGVGFHPGEGVVFTEGGDKYVNTYRARIPEPLKPTAEECKKIEWMFARIYDEAYRTWLLKFYAYVIQHPGVKIRSAPLIWSETQGNGKSMLTDRVPALLVGDQYHVQIGADVLEGTFNDALARAWHVSLSEFSGGSRRENDQVTKKVERWIIETKLELHQKNVGAATVPNHLFVTASSNKENAAAISNDDRKWGIHKMLAPALTEDEMAWIFEGFLNTARAPGVLRHYFLAVDTTGFNPSARAPLTAAKTEMAKSNEGADSELLENWLDEHTGPFAKDIVTITDVTDALRKNLHYGIRLRHVARLLLRPPFNAEKRQIRWSGGKPWVYIVRNYKNRWRDAKESAIVAHLQGDEISVEDDLLN